LNLFARYPKLLDSAKQFQTLLGGNGIQPPAVDAAAVAAEQEVRRAKTRRTRQGGTPRSAVRDRVPR
jgi:hypothetical protein